MDAAQMKRRKFITVIGASAAAILGARGMSIAGPRSGTAIMAQLSPPFEKAPTLLSAPIELGGEWGASPPNDALAVIFRMREVCLSGVRLLSDRQPAKLRVDDHTSGPPHIWLHDENPDTAWIVVDIGARDWCKLSYQFGHELGHVLCNSWQSRAKPKSPSQRDRRPRDPADLGRTGRRQSLRRRSRRREPLVGAKRGSRRGLPSLMAGELRRNLRARSVAHSPSAITLL